MKCRIILLCLISTVILQSGKLVTGQDCFHTITDQSGILEYPGNAEKYTSNLFCQWTFIANANRVVEITFTNIDLQPEINSTCFDTITVDDGDPGSNPATDPFCGDGPFWPRNPVRFLSTSNRLSITMETDDIFAGMGFVAEYKHVSFRRESIAAINSEKPSIIQFNRFAKPLFETIPLKYSLRPSALDFDPINEFFYYTDIGIGFIGRIKYDSSSDRILIARRVQTPLGIAVGYLTGLLYWTDIDRHEVSVSRLDGSFRKTLVSPNTGCDSPSAITLSADQQNVFWTCAGRIMKAKADGTDDQTIVDGLSDPRAIVLDREMFLYWVDVNTSSVGRIRTDGTMKNDSLLFHGGFSITHSFVMDGFAYFFSIPTFKSILHMNRSYPLHSRNYFTTTYDATIEGLYYYNSDAVIAQQHICLTGRTGCRELCFPQGVSFSCVDRVCSHTISDQKGTLNYPGDGEPYEDDLNCTWLFIAPVGRYVEILFTKIDLELSDNSTCYDNITIYDGAPGINPVTSPFCNDGPTWPPSPFRFLSTSNKLSIAFKSDSSLTRTGFVAEYKHVLFRRESMAAINSDEPSIIQFNRFATPLFDTIRLSRSTHPSALDFDPITEYFYYSDIDAGFIGKIKFDGRSDSVLIRRKVQTPLGIAVGYLTGLLYWTDKGRHEVSVSRLNGRYRKPIFFPNTGCNSPRDIALSTDQQNVFWTCTGKIMKARADGLENETLVDGISDPRAIALDEEMFLYWVDVYTSSVGRIKTNGTMRNDALITSDSFSGVHGFVMDAFTYFWSRPTDKDFIVRARVNSKGTSHFSFRENPVAMEGLYYYQSDKLIPGRHRCRTASWCQELCFPQGVYSECVEVTPNVVNCPNRIEMNTSRLYQRVYWVEPSAVSRTSQQNGKPLVYSSRTNSPGSSFGIGSTTVRYTFQDEFSNTATCSFTIVVLRATTTTETVVTTAKTSKPKSFTVSSYSYHFYDSYDFPWNFPKATTTHPTPFVTTNSQLQNFVYIILVVIAALFCVNIVIVGCIACCNCLVRSSGRNYRSTLTNNAQLYRSDMQPQPSQDGMDCGNKAAINMVPVGNTMASGYPSCPPQSF